MDDIFPKI